MQKNTAGISRAVPAGSTPGIRDNHSRGTVGDFLRSHLRPGADLDLVTAYFTVFAYDKLRSHLNALGHIRLLFGEAAFIKNIDAAKSNGARYVLQDDGLALANGLSQRHVAEACARWMREKVEVRSVTRTGFLHGKMAHIRRGEVSAAILGSSNFTTRGLGLAPADNNVELNLIVRDDRDRDDLLNWFEELWEDTDRVTDVKQCVLDYLMQVFQDQSPEFLYFKTLFELFRDLLDTGAELDAALRRTSLLETEMWKALFEFQKDGAKAAINKLRNFNGCVLADSVGLGKTFEALAVIKYFELKNERALVLCPKKLADNWLLYRQNSKLNPFERDRFRYDVLHHTDLSRDTGLSNGIDLAGLNWGNYDLVVIDESHNFRNNAIGPTGDDGLPVRRTRYERLIQDIIRAGIRTKVLLLSATPVNNELADLRNQISFIAGGDVAREASADAAFDSLLEIHSIKTTTRDAQARFTTWAKLSPAARSKKDLIHVLGGDFLKLLDALTIARSRRHVVRHYESEMDRLGGFPERIPPVSLHSEIDSGGQFPSYDDVASQITRYRLWLFRPSEHLRPDLATEIREGYVRRIGGFTQQGRERILTGMMRVSLLKRLESSIDSFRISLRRTLEKIERLETRMDRFEAFRAENPDLDYDALSPDEIDDPELADALQVGRRVTFKMAHLNLSTWRVHLAEDRAQLSALLRLADPISVDRDAKLGALKELIADKVKKPSRDKDGKANRKMLVFTAYADTAKYLYANLHKWADKELGVYASMVVGSGDNDSTYTTSRDFTEILLDFSPRSKRRADIRSRRDEAEVDLLIASDCISEGQNLQDCDTVINYDIHWNPVRIIQRFGRIDRIGSKATAVHLVNFWPTAHLDQYINLKLRVEARMALVDLAATQTDNPLDDQQLEDLVTADLRLRDRQLERLRTEIIDLEEFEDTVTLADFSLDDFRMDLLRYLEANRENLEGAPAGLYAVVPPADAIPMAGPGVIFCLRHKGKAEARANEKVNPLAPYYLVYIQADGQVRLTFTQAKTILNLFRELALGKTEPYGDLCRLFDRQTEQGHDMKQYSELLRTSVASITSTFQQKLASGLQGGRQFVLPTVDEQILPDSDFELVTWLVVLKAQ
jgi:SNF2 family DNA or RNA helicase